MTSRLRSFGPRSCAQFILLLCVIAGSLALSGCGSNPPAQTVAQTQPSPAADLAVNVSVRFRFVAYGDTRFHDPRETAAANRAVRVALVQAIADTKPAFICFTGDIVYNGYDENDWKIFDSETSIWREKHIPVFPALGNHELHGNQKIALANYFQRFPDLKDSRYYSVRAANTLLLVLDSSIDEVSGPQGQWLINQLDNLPPDVDFVFVVLHHPPYTNSSMDLLGQGHLARSREQNLARILEDRQSRTRARFIVLSGHVHNYERQEHRGVTYFVSGGGGAHPYLIKRAPDDPLWKQKVNYHYLLLEVDHRQLKITMNRLQFVKGKAVWTQPDTVTIAPPAAAATAAAR